MAERRHAFVGVLAERGLPTPEAGTMEALRDIVDEGILGASNHVARALPAVVEVASAPRDTALDEARALAEFIAETRGEGAPIVANAVRWLMKDTARLPRDEATQVLSERAAQWDALARERREQLVAGAVDALREMAAPLLFDYSSTVVDVVRACAQARRLERLVVPESRAINGGRRYVDALSSLGVAILFLPDAAIEFAMGHADAVLLGAESVTRDGAVVNTIGSLATARAANARGVPVHGAADLYKVSDRSAADLAPPAERTYDFLLNEGESISTTAPELEIVPAHFVSSLLTEVGAMPPGDVAAAASRIG